MTDDTTTSDSTEPSKTSNLADALDGDNIIHEPDPDTADPDDTFRVSEPQPTIHILKKSKGFLWLLVSADGKKLAVSAEPRSRIRDLKADIQQLQMELPIAAINKLY